MGFRAVVRWTLALGLCGILGCVGRSTPKAPAQPFRGVSLTASAVGDPAIMATVLAERGEWQVTQGAEVRVETAAADPKAPRADVLLFPADRMGDLVDVSALAILPDSVVRPAPPAGAEDDSPRGETNPISKPDPLAFHDVAPAYRDQVTRYGMADRMGLPYGGSALVLLYRLDAMERAENRSAAKEAGLTLEPPRSWEQLDALARFFQGRDWDGDGEPEKGVALALGDDPEGVGGATFLNRAAALGQHPFHYAFLFDSDTMEPRIASPPFVEAMKGLVALKDAGPPGMEAFDAQAARAAFRSGEVALLIDRAERTGQWAGPGKSARIGVAALPGSDRVYEPSRQAWEKVSTPNRPSYLPGGGGWLVGVSSTATGVKREAAIDFVKYLISPETSRRVLADRSVPMLPVRASQLAQGPVDPRQAPGVDTRLWARAVTETLMGDRVVPGLRIPQAEAYLADLDRARLAVVKGEPSERALQAAAKAWSDRTEKLGKARQLWHYRRSLNTLPTSPEPPAR